MKDFVFLIIIVAVLVVSNGVAFVAFNSPLITGNSVSSEESDSRGYLIGNKVVTKIIDGDTVIIEGESVRLLGMDTDERGYPCFTEAKKRVEELLLGKTVFLEPDKEDKDQYDRYLRYIFLDGKNINLQMVEEGLAVARVSPEDTRYKTEMISAEKEAREAGVGCKWKGEVKTETSKAVQKESDSDEDEEEETTINEGDYVCDKNQYNCGDFSSQKEAQEVFDACGGAENDIHILDKDKDGVVCESLA